MNDVDSCLEGSVGQAATDALSLNIWTTSSTKKSQDWLTSEPAGLKSDIGGLFNSAPDSAWIQKISTWISNNCNNNQGPNGKNLDQWSSALVIYFQSIITQDETNDKNSGDQSLWNPVIGAVSSFGNLVSSQMTQDTTTPDSEGKNMQSQLQTDNSALQPIADFGGSWAQNLSSLANSLAQMSPS